MFNKSLLPTLLALSLMFMGQSPATAGLATDATRVIFTGKNNESTLQVANLNEYPIVVQAWVDNGEVSSTPNNTNAPVISLPPIFRLSPGELRSIRLIYSGEKLPDDRESLYWLNLYEVPPNVKDKSEPPDSTRLVITLRMQLKVFLRPENLAIKPENLTDHLSFSVTEASNGNRLHVKNPTPYFVTFSGVSVENGEHTEAMAGDMLAPFSEDNYPLQGTTKPLKASPNTKVRFTIINDEGNSVTKETPLQ